MDKLAYVNSSGVVVWTPHGRLRSHCNIDLSLFPFDTQHCRLTFGPWSYDRSLVTVRLNPATKNLHREFIEVSVIAILILLLLLLLFLLLLLLFRRRRRRTNQSINQLVSQSVN